MKIGATTFLATLLAALMLTACEVEQTEEGELPDVDVQGGNLPEYDVEGPDVDVGTEKKTIEVPDVDVDVDSQEKEVTVPDVDVEFPDDKGRAD